MSYNFIVEFQIRKGLGPDFVQKLIPVYYDDIEADTPEYVVIDWAIKEAEGILIKTECPAFVYVNIHYA